MEGETAAAAPATKRTMKKLTLPHLPHETVSEILLRLPARSLLRFNSVCKVWRGTISDDASFRRAHLCLHRRDRPCVLIARQMNGDDTGRVTTAGLYLWREERQGTATLLHPMTAGLSFRAEVAHGFAHCDGLVLAPMVDAVRVLNPATRRVLTLPWSAGGLDPYLHQAFGLGRDPRSGAYKVALFFHREEHDPATNGGGYIPRVEVFTIGSADMQYWRETAAQPPCPVMAARTATFFKGSLLWTANVRYGAGPGFVRFSLDDEAFNVTPAPPCFFSGAGRLDTDAYKSFNLSELSGELCVLCPRGSQLLEMWMCDDVDGGAGDDPPRWDLRYTLLRPGNGPLRSVRPVTVFDNGVLVCHEKDSYYMVRCSLQSGQGIIKDIIWFNKLGYYNPSEGTLVHYPWESSYFDAIPYVPSLVQI